MYYVNNNYFIMLSLLGAIQVMKQYFPCNYTSLQPSSGRSYFGNFQAWLMN